MSSYYSVVRFVPSALAEEFINVGVLTFGDGRVRGKFLDNWHRVEKFADAKNLSHVRGFQEWVLQSMVPESPSHRRMRPIDEAAVRAIAVDWAGSVQLSAPRGSLLDPEALLEDVATTFLVEPPPPANRAPDKRRVVTAASDSLRAAIRRRLSPGAHLAVQTRRPVSALVRPRVFDIVLTNGSPRYAVQCFNFNVADSKKMLEQVDAVAFAIEDVRKQIANFPVDVVASPPDEDSDESYDQATQTFAEVGAKMIRESEVSTWSDDVAERLLPSAT